MAAIRTAVFALPAEIIEAPPSCDGDLGTKNPALLREISQILQNIKVFLMPGRKVTAPDPCPAAGVYGHGVFSRVKAMGPWQ
jgi:hypothetical protein